MIVISKATLNDSKLLSEISIKSFLPAHGHSAPKEEINKYLSNSFSITAFEKELKKPENIYYLIYCKNKIAGYSKILLNNKCPEISIKNITYMSRLYLLKEFYGLGLGKKLMAFNINLAKENNQKGMWLKVWVENKKAIEFYSKNGFKIVGKSGFKISETHSNPNHHLYLEF